VRIAARDGVRLSANLFLPLAQAPGERFPAILEMIPYRKDDWRYNTDSSRMTYLARHGYGCCRLDGDRKNLVGTHVQAGGPDRLFGRATTSGMLAAVGHLQRADHARCI
jgi:hypothetical protein